MQFESYMLAAGIASFQKILNLHRDKEWIGFTMEVEVPWLYCYTDVYKHYILSTFTSSVDKNHTDIFTRVGRVSLPMSHVCKYSVFHVAGRATYTL